MTENIQQALQLATANAQLSILIKKIISKWHNGFNHTGPTKRQLPTYFSVVLNQLEGYLMLVGNLLLRVSDYLITYKYTVAKSNQFAIGRTEEIYRLVVFHVLV